MRFMARYFGLMFGGIFFVVGLTFFIVGVTAWQTERRFDTDAVTAEGKVLTRDIERASSSNNSSTKYRVTYRFESSADGTIEATDDVDVGTWEALEEQGPVTVEYLRDEPDTNRVAGSGDRVLAVVFTSLGGLFGLIGAGVLVVTVRRLVEKARLRREGVDAVATIIAVEESNFRVNRVVQWRTRYSYRDQLGREYEGQGELIPPNEAADIVIGTTGPVRYDRDRPERSVWLGAPDG